MSTIQSVASRLIIFSLLVTLQACGSGSGSSSQSAASNPTDSSMSSNTENSGSGSSNDDSGSNNDSGSNGSNDGSGSDSGSSNGDNSSGTDSGSSNDNTDSGTSNDNNGSDSETGSNNDSADSSDNTDPNNTISGDYASEQEDSYPVVTPVNTQTSVAGKFRIDDKGNITEDGQVFPVRCGNWFGLDGQQEPKNAENNPDGAPMELYIGNMWWFNGSQGSGRTIENNMKEIKAMGINMVRLPIVPQTLSPTHPQGMGDASQKNGGALKNHPSVQQENALEGLKSFLKLADKHDIKVLLDLHSCSNYVGWRAGRIDAAPPWVDADRIGYQFSREDWSCNAGDAGKKVTLADGSTVTMNVDTYDESKWLADLQKIAQLPTDLGIDNVIGIDIFNEPWEYKWDEWSTLAEKAYAAINSVNKDVLVFVEGVGDLSDYGATEAYNPNWGENLYGFAKDPLDIPQDRLVLSPHTYGPSVFVQEQFLDPNQAECKGLSGDEAAAKDCKIVIDSKVLRKGWHQHFGFLRDQGYAVVVGEFGGNMDWPSSMTAREVRQQWSHITTDVDVQWQKTFVNYMLDNNIHACYWSINPESSDTYGWIKTLYDPVSGADKWGTWGDSSGKVFDDRKTQLLHKLWQFKQ